MNQAKLHHRMLIKKDGSVNPKYSIAYKEDCIQISAVNKEDAYEKASFLIEIGQELDKISYPVCEYCNKSKKLYIYIKTRQFNFPSVRTLHQRELGGVKNFIKHTIV